ncbi:MAG: efflux RND transporter periplasmic adaptor subunit [Fibrobacterota bacterium]|nr:efflux RND transporter periplasmic adaptor subunit [Fibrobacterota bacterium]
MMAFSKPKLPIILVLAAVLAGGGAYWLWGRKPEEVKWRTGQAERGPLQVSVTATGILQAVVTVLVGTQVSGTVSALYVDFNSQVKKGQVIAGIDTTLLRAALMDARSNMEKVEAQERQAADEMKRAQALFAKGLVSQSEADQAMANARVAAANLNSAKAQMERARINLRFATIVSPIDGIVLSRAVDVGQTVAASFNTPTLFTIAGDLREMQVQASVDEADIGKVKTGQRATFSVDAYPDSLFTGEVKQIRLQPVTVQNVVSYDVVISVPNPNLQLMPGMTASLTIAIARKDDVVHVPAAALQFSPKALMGGKGKRVFVLENGNPKPIEVKIGMSDGSRTEVTGSLEPGTEVLTGVEASKQSGPAAGSSPFGMPRMGGGRGGAGGGGGRAH